MEKERVHGSGFHGTNASVSFVGEAAAIYGAYEKVGKGQRYTLYPQFHVHWLIL